MRDCSISGVMFGHNQGQNTQEGKLGSVLTHQSLPWQIYVC